MERIRDPLIGIGSHAVTHRKLPRLSPEELAHELVDSRTAIGEECGTVPSYLAYPKGSWNRAVEAAAAAAGYAAAFTVENRSVHLNDGRFALPRIQVDSTTTLAAFRAKLTPAADWYQALWKLRQRLSRLVR
jgi:peptidoglycan/xylan/chitin deacetylase (PgdA/CDA1 family)